MPNFAMSFHQLTAPIISLLAALLQLKYQTQDPFATLPTTMFVAVSSIMLYYIIQIGLLRSPTSRFAAIAQHFLVLFAYVAFSTLAAALLPDRASPFIYTIFGMLSIGHTMYVFRHKLATEDEGEGEDESEEEEEDEDEGEEASNYAVYRRSVFRFLKNMCCSVSKFFEQKPPPILPI